MAAIYYEDPRGWAGVPGDVSVRYLKFLLATQPEQSAVWVVAVARAIISLNEHAVRFLAESGKISESIQHEMVQDAIYRSPETRQMMDRVGFTIPDHIQRNKFYQWMEEEARIHKEQVAREGLRLLKRSRGGDGDDEGDDYRPARNIWSHSRPYFFEEELKWLEMEEIRRSHGRSDSESRGRAPAAYAPPPKQEAPQRVVMAKQTKQRELRYPVAVNLRSEPEPAPRSEPTKANVSRRVYVPRKWEDDDDDVIFGKH